MAKDTEARPIISGGLPTIFISDMERSVKFYTETLGLALHMRAGDHFAMIDAGNGMLLGLHPPSSTVPVPGTNGSIQLGLNVTQPIEDVVRGLESRGVSFEQRGNGPVVDDGAVKLAYFSDPDGTQLYLCETVQE